MDRRTGVGVGHPRWLGALAITTLVCAASASDAQASNPRPLPQQVVSKAPDMHPFGKGRHSWWGVQMYDATLWIAGPQWSPAEPHAIDLEPKRTVPSSALVKAAIDEMRSLKVGDERQLKAWQSEMNQVIPSVKAGDQVVIFCTDANHTLVFLNDSSNGEINDPTFCPAVMSVWLHPQTKHQAMRKSLLRQ